MRFGRKSPESVCNECLKTSAVPWRRLKRSAMSRSTFGTYSACLIEHFFSVSAVIKQQNEPVTLAVPICLTPTKRH